MRIDTGKVTASQLMFSVACYIQGSTLLTSVLFPITKQDSWIVIALGSLLFIPLLWIYIKLMQRFPDKNLVEINDAVYGPVAGKLVTILYLWFFITLTALNLRDLGEFLNSTILVKTPNVVILGFFTVICAWAVYYGIRVVSRYSSLFVFIALAILIIVTFLTINLMKLENLLPMLDQKPMNYVQGTNIIMTIPFGEVVVFLMVTPNIRKQKKSISKYLIGGFVIGAATMLTVAFRDTAVLGNTMGIYALPSFETLRMVSISQALSRMEILFAVVLIILLFFKVSFLYYVTTLTTAHLFNLKSYHSLVLTMGVIIVTYAVLIFPSSVEHAIFGQGIAPILWLPFEYLLPLVTLFVAGIRRLPRKTEAD